MNPSPNSYTSMLTLEAIREKIMEEAQELVNAKEKEEIIWEAADLIYFISVMLAKEGASLEAVLNELKRRRKMPKKRN